MSSGRSPAQDAGENLAGNAEPFYTNEDVAVLHDIVVLAQEVLPTLPDRERLPTNALFNAYYDILPRVGVNADHDSRYARILFKIGGLRGERTLYEKFEEILSRMGIEIEFDQEDTGDVYSQIEHQHTKIEAGATESSPQERMSLSRGRRRRNSDSFAWNVGSKYYFAHHKERRNSFSPHRKPPQPLETTGQEEINLSQKFRLGQAAQAPHGDQSEHVGAWVASMGEEPQSERGRSVSTHGSIQIRRQSSSAPRSHFELPTNPSNNTIASSSNRFQKVDSSNLLKGYILSRDSDTLLQTKASLVLQYRLGLAGRRQLRLWRDKAMESREHNARLYNLAWQKDKNVLLALAFDNWRSSLLEMRHQAETELFFAHLERRSEQARNLYLLHKAFTHWAIRAFEQVERTSVARRHIIKTRTFNAWRDITAINELKVRRQIIKKFFVAWKRQRALVSSDHTRTIQFYEGNLVEKIYKQWICRLANIKAAVWRSGHTKQQAFLHWAIVAQSAEEHRRSAEERRLLNLTRKAWQIWTDKTRDRSQRNREARVFYEAQISATTLRKWRQETRVTPAKKTLQIDLKLRLLRNNFALWLQRARQERQAELLDRIRIIREAYTNWRHKLRFQVLRARVNNHAVLRSVYKWVLTERSVLAQRLMNQRVLVDCVHNWRQYSKTMSEYRWDQEDLAQAVAIRKAQDLNLQHWRSQFQTRQQQEADAEDFYIPRRLGSAFSRWVEHIHHLQQLERWYRDAEYYFLASKMLKRWKASTEGAKREKRKASYIQVRRTMKIKLAKSVLFAWHRQAQQIQQLHNRAIDLNQNRTVVIAMNMFDRWRARAEDLEELNALVRATGLRKQFTLWRGRTTAFLDLEAEAAINSQERQQGQVIKKWGLLALQLRSHSHYAAEIREKNLKRAFRKSFTYWQQRTAQKLPPKSLHQGASTDMRRVEIWSESGDDTEVDEWARGLDDLNAFTPVPGYLKTPSKRVERVTAAVARFSSTTPHAPLPSPFSRLSRGQYLTSSLSSVRKGGVRSQLNVGAEFADIAETSNNDIHGFT
jgi:protein SFI1